MSRHSCRSVRSSRPQEGWAMHSLVLLVGGLDGDRCGSWRPESPTKRSCCTPVAAQAASQYHRTECDRLEQPHLGVRPRDLMISWHAAAIIGLLGWKPGRPGPGGNPSACRWKAVRSILPGDNQVRHCLAVPAVNRGRACRGSAWRLGSFGPVCEARTSTRCLRVSGWNPGHS